MGSGPGAHSVRREVAASVFVAALCATLVCAWWSLTVRFNFQGNWTALYCTGSRMAQPPALADEKIYLFHDGFGYDGQAYHYIAHDPWMRRGFARFVDAPRFRYRRILVPALAWLLAMGQDRFVDRAYLGVFLAFVMLGAYATSRVASSYGLSPAWGLGFLLGPPVLVSIDRLTVDAALAALCAAFALLARRGPSPMLWLVLAAAPLARETGVLLLAGYCAYLLLRRQVRVAALYATALVPVAAWNVFVNLTTNVETKSYIGAIPLSGFLQRLFHPQAQPFGPVLLWTATTLDYLALFAVAAAAVWVIRAVMRGDRTPLTMAALAFVVLAVFLDNADAWYGVFDFGRTLGPLVLLVALTAPRLRSMVLVAPMLLTDLRIGLQMGREIMGIVSALLPRG